MQGQTPCCVGVEIEQIIFDHELGQRVVHARSRGSTAAAAAAAPRMFLTSTCLALAYQKTVAMDSIRRAVCSSHLLP